MCTNCMALLTLKYYFFIIKNQITRKYMLSIYVAHEVSWYWDYARGQLIFFLLKHNNQMVLNWFCVYILNAIKTLEIYLYIYIPTSFICLAIYTYINKLKKICINSRVYVYLRVRNCACKHWLCACYIIGRNARARVWMQKSLIIDFYLKIEIHCNLSTRSSSDVVVVVVMRCRKNILKLFAPVTLAALQHTILMNYKSREMQNVRARFWFNDKVIKTVV